jgi:peptidoglycan hydrolase-like protein with peptidoglycan-binding domain
VTQGKGAFRLLPEPGPEDAEQSEDLVTDLGSPAMESNPAGGAGPAGPARLVAGGSRLVRRRRVLLGAGLAAALLAAGGLIGASFVKSPQQLAADTAAPPSTVTTAPVVSQVLTSSVQMRGVVYPATEYDVFATAPGTAPATGAAAGAGGSPVYISKLDTAAGHTVSNGQQLAELDGQPLFALAGPVPAWRDLMPGDTGPDVTELQRALAALGYYGDGDAAGYFGSATQYAVDLYYEHLGYAAPAAAGVPAADVLFLPSLPATVVAVNGGAGEQPGQPFLELAARGSLALAGELPPAYAGQVRPGLKVTIYDEVTGIRATGTVAGLGTATAVPPAGAVVDVGGGSAAAGASGSASPGSASSGSGSSASGSSGAPVFIPVSVRPSAPLAAALNGENVLVTVQTGQTEGPVLTVPAAAIVTTASGTSYVTVAAASGAQTRVRVTPGLSENGYVQVTPAAPGSLAAGDRVVVSG